MAAKILSASEVASELGTDPKTFRKFLRSDLSPVERVGQGNRYEIPAAKVRQLTKAYKAWAEARNRTHAEA